MKLDSCKEGDTAVIRSVSGAGAIKKRLLEMGFTKGTEVKILRHAPLRDPIELEIKGSRLSLRVSEAHLIEVQSPVRQAKGRSQ
jgi:Fe2+ transport system protein FeoA